MTEIPDVDATVRQIETLRGELCETDPGSRPTAEELIRLLMQLYGAGLSRIMQTLQDTRAQEAVGRLSEDRLVASLLLLHDIHPIPADERIRAALDRVERRIQSHHLSLK